MIVSALAAMVLVLLYAVLFLYRQRGESTRDLVTGLPTKDQFFWFVDICAARAARVPSYRFSVLLLDNRGFEEIAAQQGGFAADEVLADFAERAFHCLRPTDVLARLDGRKFGIVLQDVRSEADVARVAIRVQQAIANAVTLASADVMVMAAIGATINLPGSAVETGVLLAQAEEALERAIDTGRPCAIFDPTLDALAEASLRLEGELADAEEGSFSLVLQPVVRSNGRDTVGFMVDMQWEHPRWGLLGSAELAAIPAAAPHAQRMNRWLLGRIPQVARLLAEEAGRSMLLLASIGQTGLGRDKAIIDTVTADEWEPVASLVRVAFPIPTAPDPDVVLAGVRKVLAGYGVGIDAKYDAPDTVQPWRLTQAGVDGVRINLADFDQYQQSAVAALPNFLAICRSLLSQIVIERVDTGAANDFVRALDCTVLACGAAIGTGLSLDGAIELVRALPSDNQPSPD